MLDKTAALKEQQGRERNERIRSVWQTFEKEEPDISTERLIRMTMDATGHGFMKVLRAVGKKK